VALERLTSLIAKYGATTVKAVMKRVMNDAERRLRAKLRELPDGEWSAVAHQDSFRAGDRAIYKIVLKMRKADDQLTFDFTGTDREVEGFCNCTYAGLRGGIMPVMMAMLCGDIPWAPGGMYRCFDVISEPGTLNNCNFPAGVGKASVGSAWATQNVVSECVAMMLDMHPEHRKSLMCVCCGTWDLAVIGRVDQDGVDTGGLHCIPMGRIADVELNEYSYPILYIWRREEADSGGPGRFRGGTGGSSCIIAHDSPIDRVHLVVSATGKALPQAPGMSGGFPAGTQYNVLSRNTTVWEQFAAGRIPASLDEIGGDKDILQQHLETSLGPRDTYYLHWQGGGGYGDPLLREPAMVAKDLATGKISQRGAHEIYGVSLSADGSIDQAKTDARRQQLRRERVKDAVLNSSGGPP